VDDEAPTSASEKRTCRFRPMRTSNFLLVKAQASGIDWHWRHRFAYRCPEGRRYNDGSVGLRTKVTLMPYKVISSGLARGSLPTTEWRHLYDYESGLDARQ
jgi:hypothetical protein